MAVLFPLFLIAFSPLKGRNMASNRKIENSKKKSDEDRIFAGSFIKEKEKQQK